MSSFIDVQSNCIKLQQALTAQGFYKGPLDGILGQLSAQAISDYRKSIGLSEAAIIDAKVLSSLNLTQESTPMAGSTIISGAIASAEDYAANFISSKIVWVSGIVVVALDTWVSTHWGLTVPDTVNGWVTAGIATAGGALVMWLRTFANTPKVVAGTTVTVQK